MNDEDLRSLALIGARVRLTELDHEKDRLLAQFPELAKKPRGPIAKAAEPRVVFDAKPARKGRGTAAESQNHVERAIEMIKAGRTMPEVRDELDRDKSWVYRVAKEAGLRFAKAPRGGAALKAQRERGKHSRKTDHAKRDALLRRVADGESVGAAARALDVNPTTAYRWTTGRGSKTRPSDSASEG